jgi:copper chaperone CopZ
MTTQNLDLTDVTATAGAGCACCATTGTAGSMPETASATGVVSTYAVAGMTCGHCVSAVTQELRAIDGVTGVDIALVAGGTSTVTVTSTHQLDDDTVGAAVDEAGYDLTGRLG